MRESNLFLKSVGLLCIVITLGLNSNAAGQPQRRALPDSNQIAVMVDTLAAKLQLSDSVKSKIKTIYIASFADLKKEQDKSRGDFRAMRNSRRDITEKREKDIKTLLNGTQKKAFEKIIEDDRNKMRERMRGRRRQF